jgi:hypothetical protein
VERPRIRLVDPRPSSLAPHRLGAQAAALDQRPADEVPEGAAGVALVSERGNYDGGGCALVITLAVVMAFILWLESRADKHDAELRTLRDRIEVLEQR